jgi:hypothetical protein
MHYSNHEYGLRLDDENDREGKYMQEFRSCGRFHFTKKLR